MAINQNHLFEELDGIKCAIVEKNATAARVAFITGILQYNGYTVIVAPSPPPKAAPAKPVVEGEPVADPAPAMPPVETFTAGVTDVMFNPVNAIFGRLLKTPGGHIVTLAYWQQKDSIAHDETPYFNTTNGIRI